MTSLYDILKANRLGMDSDPWIAILGEAWKASEEEFKEYTGLVPYTFIANGQPLIDWYIKGNMQQAGTPTSDNPIQPQETGDLETVGDKAGQYKIPISSASTTTPVYLGEVETTRRIKKYEFTGQEIITFYDTSATRVGFYFNRGDAVLNGRTIGICSHFKTQSTPASSTIDGVTFGANDKNFYFTFSASSVSEYNLTDLQSIKDWLVSEYAAGTPVTVWYVLAEPKTGIVNEPLRKIGDYADTLTATQAGIEIPTDRGRNTIDIDTDIKPSEFYMKWKER